MQDSALCEGASYNYLFLNLSEVDWDTANLGMPSVLLLRLSTAVGIGYSYIGYPEIFLAAKEVKSSFMKVRSGQHYYRHVSERKYTLCFRSKSSFCSVALQ